VTATPASCYSFVNWTDGGTVVSTSASYTFTASGNRTLVANFAPITYTISTSSSPSAGGSTSGGGTVNCGQSVTVTATPAACYNFLNWTEGGTVVSTSASYTFSASGNRSLVANFALITYTLSTSSSPTAGGSTSGGGTVNCGASVTVVATSNVNYSFVNWTEGGTPVSTSASYTFTATASRELVANFSFTPTYTIVASASPLSGGTTTGTGSYTNGQTVTVTTSANSCYTFANWTEGGAVVSGSPGYAFTVVSNRSLVANFTLSTYTISVSNPFGCGSISGGGPVNCGQSVTVCAVPNSCCTFVDWTEGGIVISTSSCFTLTATGGRTLVANFSPVTYTISTSSWPPADGSTGGGGTVSCGQSVTVTAVANTGYVFTNWTEYSSVVSTSPSYTFTAAADRTLVANFASVPVRPPNDNFADRIALTGLTITNAGQNTNATKELGEPNHAGATGGRSVWWSWVAPASGTATVSTAGSSFDTVLGVYTGPSVSNLLPIASNDDANAGTSTSLVMFPAVAETEYEIAVDGYGGAFGRIDLNISLEVPPSAPVVTGSLVGNQIVLSWGTNWTGFVLESAKNLATGATWDHVSPPPVVVGRTNMVTNSIARPALFYRLRRL